MAFSSSTDFEKKVDYYLKSSSKLNALEANRLEMHWKKLCEQEQISKKRNKELLKDFERVAQQALVFDSRTQSLKAAKKKYEDFINLMYLRWKEELEHHRLLTQSNREKIPKNVYEGRNKELEHTQTSFPSQSTRGESGPLSKSSYHSPDTRGYFFPPSQLDKSSNRSRYGKDPMNEHINENSHWDPNSFRNQSLGRDFLEPSHSMPDGSRSGSYHESFHDSFYTAKVADEKRPPLSSFERFDEKNYQRYEYHDNEMPQHGPYPQQGYPYSRTYHEGQQPHNGNNRHQGFKDMHNPNNDFENRIYQEHSYNNPRGHGRYSPPGHKMYDRGGYGVSYGSEPRRQMEGYHEPIGNGMERSRVSQYYTPSDYLPGNGDQKHYNKDNKGLLEVFERHSEQPSDLVDGSRTKALAGSKAVENSRQHTASNETTQPSKNIAENPESARKKVIEQTDSTDLADRRVERFKDKEVVYNSNHEKLDQIRGRKSEGGIGERPNNLLVDTENNEGYRSYVTRQNDSSIDTLKKVKESKQEIAEGIETMKVDSSMIDDEDGNEEYVFPAREEPEVAEGFVNPSKDRGKLSKQLETVEKPVRESVERSLSDDSLTEWTKERSEGDGDFEDVSELSLPDGTTGQSQTKNAAEEKLTDEGKEKRTAIESKHNTVPGSSVVAENVISTSRHKEDSSEVISKEENPFIDRNNENKDNTILEHNVQERDQLAEERDIHNLEERKLPAVTEDALISLLQFVDGDLEVSFSPETIYRSPACSSDMKEEIIKCALNGASLENFDPSTVSMIVLEQLPLFVRSTESAALITDDTLKLSSKIQKEQNLRSEIRSSLRTIWKVLFLHLVKLVVNNVMTLREVGVLFSPLVLQENSQYVCQAEMLLTRLIKDTVENGADLDNEKENLLPSLSLTGDGVSVSQDGDHNIADKLSHSSEDTSSTFSGTPPIKSVTVDTLEPGARPRSEESLYSYEDDFDDEVPVTKTTSYQKLMSSTQIDEIDDVSDNISQSGRSKHSTEIVSEADEDLERQLERSISPPAITSPRQRSLRQKGSEKKKGKQRPKLSVFNDGASLGLSYGSGDLGESWDSEHGRTLTSSMKSDLASSLSPPLSPDPSYVPSAMEGGRSNFRLSQPSEKKSELKSINKAVKRKPGFWNQSDTESEVDLQLSTGGNPLDDEIDDFDFYG